jgi:hypothetical protein
VTTPQSGWIDPNPPPTTDPRVNTVLTVAAVALALLLIVTLAGVVIANKSGTSDDDAGQTVVLAAANTPMPEAFTPSAVVAPTQISENAAAKLAETAQQLPLSADRGVRLASGTQPGLYGGTATANSCDAAALANYFDAHPDTAAVWAHVMGIAPQQIPSHLNTLTPVILTVDTWVTSYAYSSGRAAPSQTVLQAGNAVLIDPVGVPRVQCVSGNPLLPPVNQNFARMTHVQGHPWSNYNAQNVVAIAYATPGSAVPSNPVSQFSLTDLSTAQPLIRSAGGTINLGAVSASAAPLPDPP